MFTMFTDAGHPRGPLASGAAASVKGQKVDMDPDNRRQWEVRRQLVRILASEGFLPQMDALTE